MKTTILLANILIVFGFSSQAQVVSTFLNDPSKKIDDGMAMDYQGNIYGSHFMGSNIYKVTPSGICTVFATGFNTPNGIAFDSQNNLYVCDLSGNRIYKLSYSGLFLDTIFVNKPSGIIKSFTSDTMLFTQYSGNKFSKLAPDGSISLIASGMPMSGAIGLAYSDIGQLYIANFTDRKIYSVNSNTFTYVATVPGPPSGGIGYIAFAQGSLWATSYNAHKIYKVYQNYIDSVYLYAGSTIGSTDGPAGKFSSPNGVISSVTGDSLFISDFGTGRVRIITLNKLVGITKYNNVSNSIVVYPNPTNSEFSIDYEFENNTNTFELYDIMGKIAFRKILIGSKGVENITTNDLLTGIYHYKITDRTGKVAYIGKLVINK